MKTIEEALECKEKYEAVKNYCLLSKQNAERRHGKQIREGYKMEIDTWVEGYKVRSFPWVDGKTIYFNVQYFAPGQSIAQPPVFDKSVYITDDAAGQRLVKVVGY